MRNDKIHDFSEVSVACLFYLSYQATLGQCLLLTNYYLLNSIFMGVKT